MESTAFDRKVYREKLSGFLPDLIVDAHVHLWTPECREGFAHPASLVSWPDLVAADCTWEDLAASYETMFPGKKVLPVLMTTPTCRLEIGNRYVEGLIRKTGLPAFYCIRPETGEEEIREAFAKGFTGVKPYLNYAPSYIPAKEIRIYDFLTPAQLRLMDELEGAVMLHIARDGRLADPVNVAQLMEIDREYPHATVIVAHVGRAYTPEALGNAFDVLKKSRRLFFDFPANTYEPAIAACLRAVGPDRLLFGSDMPITKMRMYRVTEKGNYVNVVPRGLYGDVSGDVHMRESDERDITTFMYEELLAFKAAAEECGLSRAEVEKVMAGNAMRIFDMKN
ncbi:MAG: amidohydrolase family protein [Clostridia bacterium]|nr:amidohydrolase family protein [Clostridia bacterium]